MSETEKYVPSSEEMQQAQSSMTDKQAHDSMRREIMSRMTEEQKTEYLRSNAVHAVITKQQDIDSEHRFRNMANDFPELKLAPGDIELLKYDSRPERRVLHVGRPDSPDHRVMGEEPALAFLDEKIHTYQEAIERINEIKEHMRRNREEKKAA